MKKFKIVQLDRKWRQSGTSIVLDEDPRPYIGEPRKVKDNKSWYWSGDHYTLVEII